MYSKDIITNDHIFFFRIIIILDGKGWLCSDFSLGSELLYLLILWARKHSSTFCYVLSPAPGLLPSVTGLSSSKEITLFYLYFFGMKENLSSSTKGLRRRQNKYLFYLYILQLALIARAKYCLSYLSTHCIILLFFFFFGEA